MNRYRITALEEVDVSVFDEHPATVRVRGVPRQVMTRGVPHWKHLSRGEACEVMAVRRIRGDFFEEDTLLLPADMATPVVIHEALRIEGLPTRHAPCSNRVNPDPLSNSKPNR